MKWTVRVGLWCLLLSLAGCTGMPVASEGAAGSPETTLVVYSTRSESLFKPVLDAFNQAHPEIKVTVLTGSNGELAAKLLEEQAIPQADLLFISDIMTMVSLSAQVLVVPNDSAAVAAVPETYRAEDGSWVALTLRSRVLMYNTDRVQAEQLPDSVLDLVDPQWKGQVGVADSRNGATIAHLVAMRHLQGEEVMADFVRGLLANEVQWFGGHTDVRKAVGSGELALGLGNHYYYHLSLAEGAPVGVIYPDQGDGGIGLVVNSTNVGIVRGARHPEPARQLGEFMLSPAGQKLYADLNFEYPVVEGVAPAAGVPPLSEFKLADVSLKTMWDELEAAQQAAQAAGLP